MVREPDIQIKVGPSELCCKTAGSTILMSNKFKPSPTKYIAMYVPLNTWLIYIHLQTIDIQGRLTP